MVCCLKGSPLGGAPEHSEGERVEVTNFIKPPAALCAIASPTEIFQAISVKTPSTTRFASWSPSLCDGGFKVTLLEKISDITFPIGCYFTSSLGEVAGARSKPDGRSLIVFLSFPFSANAVNLPRMGFSGNFPKKVSAFIIAYSPRFCKTVRKYSRRAEKSFARFRPPRARFANLRGDFGRLPSRRAVRRRFPPTESRCKTRADVVS